MSGRHRHDGKNLIGPVALETNLDGPHPTVTHRGCLFVRSCRLGTSSVQLLEDSGHRQRRCVSMTEHWWCLPVRMEPEAGCTRRTGRSRSTPGTPAGLCGLRIHRASLPPYLGALRVGSLRPRGPCGFELRPHTIRRRGLAQLRGEERSDLQPPATRERIMADRMTRSVIHTGPFRLIAIAPGAAAQ